MHRFQNPIKAMLLMAMGLFFYSRITGGTLYYYINERFAAFTVIGVVGLLLLGFSYRWDQQPTAAEGHDHDHDHNHAHDHNHNHDLTWVGALIVLLPIILGVAITPQPLGAAALANRDVTLSMSESAMPLGVRNREKAPADKNIMDWWNDFRSAAGGLETFIGQEVKVSGFVYQDERYGTEQFMVTRFVVSCCVADANVLGLLVQWPADQTPANDQWVEVAGVFIANPNPNSPMPMVAARTVTPIEVPNQPYMYP